MAQNKVYHMVQYCGKEKVKDTQPSFKNELVMGQMFRSTNYVSSPH